MHYNLPSGFDKYLSIFEELCSKIEACDQGLADTQKHNFFLNGIKDEDFKNIKNNCDKKSFKETVIALKKKPSSWVKVRVIPSNIYDAIITLLLSKATMMKVIIKPSS